MSLEDIIKEVPEENRESVKEQFSNYMSEIVNEKVGSVKSEYEKQIEKLNQENQDISQSDPDEIKTLSEQIASMKELYETERQKRNENEKKLKENKIKERLKKEIDGKYYASNSLIENILLKGELEMKDGRIIDKNGRKFEDYISDFKEKHKNELKQNQKRGTGNIVNDNNVGGEKSFAQKVKERLNSMNR